MIFLWILIVGAVAYQAGRLVQREVMARRLDELIDETYEAGLERGREERQPDENAAFVAGMIVGANMPLRADRVVMVRPELSAIVPRQQRTLGMEVPL